MAKQNSTDTFTAGKTTLKGGVRIVGDARLTEQGTAFTRQEALSSTIQLIQNHALLAGHEEHFILVREETEQETVVLRDGTTARKVPLSAAVGTQLLWREFGGFIRIVHEFSEGRDMFTVEQAAKYLGMSLSALRGRIATARRCGEWEPFKRVGVPGRELLLVEKLYLEQWVATWTGRRKKRPRRAPAEDA